MRNAFENNVPDESQTNQGFDAVETVLDILQEHGMSEVESWDVIRGIQGRGVSVTIASPNGNRTE
ncbi:hypothetical protein SEA_MADAMATO_65 [Streptomyces phage Madamato]|nr:hypothetical protein SEA_MADAMATO_65 [Streptomyces phage Madamato]